MNAVTIATLIEQHNALVPAYIDALRQDYATRREDAFEARIEVQNEMLTVLNMVHVPCYIDPETFLLVEGVAPDREAWIDCLMPESEYVHIYLDEDDYDMPIGLESRIIREACHARQSNRPDRGRRPRG